MATRWSRTLSATEAKNRFGAVLREVARTGGPVLVERGGKPIAVILSIQTYEETQRVPPSSAGNLVELARASFGMWAGRQDIDPTWLERNREHWQSEWTDV